MSKFEITVNGNKFVVEIGDLSGSPIQVMVNGEARTVQFAQVQETSAAPAQVVAPPQAQPTKIAPPQAQRTETPPQAQPVEATEPSTARDVVAPMPGKIMSIRVKPGDKVAEGDTICTLEAMKMEMPISTTSSGTVQAVHVNVGDNVAYNDRLVSIG